MKKIYTIGIALTILFLFAIISYTIIPFFISFESRCFIMLSDLLPIAFAGIAVILGRYTYKVYGWKSLQGKIWFLLVLGIFFWFLGELSWAIYEVILNVTVPFPSWADAAWLIGYPLIFLALIFQWRATGGILGAKKLSLIFLLCALAAIISGFFLLAPIAVDTEIDMVEKFLDLAYPVGDLVIIFGALVVPFVFRKGAISKSWAIISAGFILSAIADTWFSYLTWNEAYIVPFTVDLFWLLSYLVIAFGFYYQKFQIEEQIKG